MFANRYGHFEQDGKTFVITDSSAPTPWVNVVSNGRYGFVVSHNGGGFSWLDNSQLNVLTRWDMDLARDSAGRYLYLSDLDTGEVWSLAPAPCRPAYDRYRCEHSPGSTRFATEFAGIRATWTMAAAPNDNVEGWLVEITNLTDKPRRLRLSSFFEWCCGVAPDVKREFHRLFFTTWHDPARKAVFASKNMWDVPPRNEAEHWNRPWPYIAAHSTGGDGYAADLATADKTAFFGRYGSPATPDWMTTLEAGAGKFGRFGDASAALGGDFVLARSGRSRFYFLTAIAETRDATAALLDKYGSLERVEKLAGEAGAAWDKRLSQSRLKSAMPDADLLSNYWLPYQAISARLWGRTGYYQQSGAFGFRDQLQDSQVWLPLDPSKCRDQILLHARHQFQNGSVYHWWHPLTETGLRTACSDDYLWLGFITAQYIKDTGDLAILDAKEPFVDDATPATLLVHIEKAISRSLSRLSPRGIPHIGSCDWNDGLSSMGVAEKGESVWLAMFLGSILADMERIYVAIGKPAEAQNAGATRAKLLGAVNEHAWDGNWYRYGTRDDGAWVGSNKSLEGKIHLNAQTWAILTGTAPTDRAASAWESVKENLLTSFGPLLLAPAYTIPDAQIGYITRYAPGSRENGGVYMHAATWALAAACEMNDVASVEKIWRSVSPPLRSSDADAYRAEPYVVPGNVDGPLSDLPGRAGWTWYTGSAQWLRRVLNEWVLGVRPTWEGLAVRPCVPSCFGVVTVSRLWRGCMVRVRYDARDARPGAQPHLTVGGRPIEGCVITPELVEGLASIDVEAVWPPRTGSGSGGGIALETSR